MSYRVCTSCLAVLFAASACGTWSNRDLEFANALPTASVLKSKIPVASSTTSPLTGVAMHHDGLNVGDPSGAYADAKSASTSFNGILDFLLSTVDAVRTVPPTSRGTDSRTWGPFSDSNNPNARFQVVITAQPATATFGWALQVSIGSADFFDIVTGTYAATTGSVKKGQGSMVVHVKAFRDVLKVDATFKDLDEIDIHYANDMAPTTVTMAFLFKVGASSGLSSIGYEYLENADFSGTMHFQLRSTDANITLRDARAGWLATGVGRAVNHVIEGNYAGATVNECWDQAFAVTYYAESWAGGVTNGLATSCASIDGF